MQGSSDEVKNVRRTGLWRAETGALPRSLGLMVLGNCSLSRHPHHFLNVTQVPTRIRPYYHLLPNGLPDGLGLENCFADVDGSFLTLLSRLRRHVCNAHVSVVSSSDLSPVLTKFQKITRAHDLHRRRSVSTLTAYQRTGTINKPVPSTATRVYETDLQY
jgi:hypothetical protein